MEEEIAACRRALVPVTGRSLSAPNYSQQVAHVGWPPFRGAHQPFFKEKGSEPEPHPDVLDRRGSRTYRLMHQLQAWRKDELRVRPPRCLPQATCRRLRVAGPAGCH